VIPIAQLQPLQIQQNIWNDHEHRYATEELGKQRRRRDQGEHISDTENIYNNPDYYNPLYSVFFDNKTIQCDFIFHGIQ
jgi:hypothetical protein